MTKRYIATAVALAAASLTGCNKKPICSDHALMSDVARQAQYLKGCTQKDAVVERPVTLRAYKKLQGNAPN